MKITAWAKRMAVKSRSSPPEYPRWPGRNETYLWMRGKIAYYREHYPDRAYTLFDISSGDYLPLTVHVAGNFGREELESYRKLKLENPDLVKQAKESTGHRWSRSTICDPEDWPLGDMLP